MKLVWILRSYWNGTQFQLANDPMGWENLALKKYRSEKYHGIFREPSVKSLTFLPNGGGAEFILDEMAQYDISADITVECYRQKHLSAPLQLAFSAALNMSSVVKENGRLKVTLDQDSAYQKLLARADVNVELGTLRSIGGWDIYPGVAPATIPLAGQNIVMRSSWRIPAGTTQSKAASYTIAASGYQSLFFMDGLMEKSELKDTNPMVALSFHEDDGVGVGNITQLIRDNVIVPLLDSMQGGVNYPISIDYDINFNGTITDTESTSGGLRDIVNYTLKLYYGNPNLPMTVIDIYSTGGSSLNVATFNFAIAATGSFTLNPGDHVYLAWVYTHDVITTPTIICEFDYDESTVSFQSTTTYKATSTKAFLIKEALESVTASIADKDDMLTTAFYSRPSGKGSMLAITNGDNLRMKIDKGIFLSFNTLFDSANAKDNIGMDVHEGKYRIEQMDFFYQNVKCCQLPNVIEFTESISPQHYINHAVVGYKQWESSFANGLDEINAKHEYTTGINVLNNKLDLVSDIIASGYAIEVTRRKNIDVSPNEDFKYDNENFWLAVKPDGSNFLPELYADAFFGGGNIQSLATMFNLRLSPKRMLLAHFAKFTAGLQIFNLNVKFVKGEGNTDAFLRKTNVGAQEDYSGAVLNENSGLGWNDLLVANRVPKWLPTVYEFEYPLTEQLSAAIEANPYGYIEFFKYPNDIHRGYIIEMTETLSSGLTKFKLLKKYGN